MNRLTVVYLLVYCSILTLLLKWAHLGWGSPIGDSIGELLKDTGITAGIVLVTTVLACLICLFIIKVDNWLDKRGWGFLVGG